MLGSFVYILDRPIESARFIPGYIQLGLINESFFGSLGDFLPSFAHIYTFVLLTVVVLRPGIKGLIHITMGWLFIEVLFELGQISNLGNYMVYHMGREAYLFFEPLINNVYLRGGTFDPLDLVALGLGAVAALLTVLITDLKERADDK